MSEKSGVTLEISRDKPTDVKMYERGEKWSVKSLVACRTQAKMSKTESIDD